jgi:transcriptional regulator with XRE-family HTH domain
MQRKAAGLTQNQLAESLQICQSNISDWENNVSRPEYEHLIKMARLYEVSLEELLGIEEMPS